jgi:hypothetical protein
MFSSQQYNHRKRPRFEEDVVQSSPFPLPHSKKNVPPPTRKRTWIVQEDEDEEEKDDEREPFSILPSILSIPPSLKRTLKEMTGALDDSRRSKKGRSIPTIFDDMCEEFRPNSLERGHRQFRHLMATLDSFDSERRYRSKEMKLMHHRMAAALAPYIYKREFAANELEIKRVNRLETVRQEIFLTAPRRGGKTTTVVQFVAACLFCLPDVQVILFAPSSRAAGGDSGFMGHLRKLLQSHPLFKNIKFGKWNEETLSIIVDGNERIFHAYPGGASQK